jgi:pimeloyl-ACP methyl ester carboxylesterase
LKERPVPDQTITTDRGGAFVHANGIDIHYVEHGAGEPLVLLHGGMMSAGPVWDGFPGAYVSSMGRIAEHFRVIAPDARSSGATVHKDGPVTMELLVDDLLALIDALGLDHPLVCGFSEGAQVATEGAIRQPGFARAIVNDAGFDLLNPQAPAFTMVRMMMGGRPDATEADPDAAASFLEQHGMGELIHRLRIDYDGAQGDGYWRTYLDLTFPRWTRWPGHTIDDLGGVTTPTLVLTGDRDMFCSVEDAVATFRALPNGELAVLPGHDHSIGAAAADASIAFLLRHAQG